MISIIIKEQARRPVCFIICADRVNVNIKALIGYLFG